MVYFGIYAKLNVSIIGASEVEIIREAFSIIDSFAVIMLPFSNMSHEMVKNFLGIRWFYYFDAR